VLVPARPGITNALGCVVADLRHDFVQTINQPVDSADIDALHALFAVQVAEGEAALAQESVAIENIERSFSVDMQFMGQSHVVRVALDDGAPSRETLKERFEAAYWARFKVELAEIRATIVNVNCSVIGERPPLDLSTLIDPEGRKSQAEPTSTRAVIFDGATHTTPVYWRDHLPLDAVINGPAIIEQMDTTILIPPGDRAEGAADGNIFIKIGGDDGA